MRNLLILLTIFCWTSLSAQNANSGWMDAILSDTPLKIDLHADFSQLNSDRRSKEFVAGAMSYENGAGELIQLTTKVRGRGKYRRRICDFPPLKLKIKKSDLASYGWSDHNDYKLVTHCMDDKAAAKDNILREYLAYKLYQSIADVAFRVQLVEVTYHDTSGKMPKMKRLGMLIEDTDNMAELAGGTDCDCMIPKPELLDRTVATRLTVFQYMIGNHDWGLHNGRNLKIVTHPDGSMTPVPYDFDFSALVNADYAVPAIDLGQRNMQDRILLLQQKDSHAAAEALSFFLSQETVILGEVSSFKLLSRNARSEITSYLNSFFNELKELAQLPTSELLEDWMRTPTEKTEAAHALEAER